MATALPKQLVVRTNHAAKLDHVATLAGLLQMRDLGQSYFRYHRGPELIN